jgi:tetratricopeptide repeat protein
MNAIKISPKDTFLIQRMALVTYKEGVPDKLQSLREAASILSFLDPETSLDSETTGLSGSVNKRMYEETGNRVFLEKAIWFYQRGFDLTNDYYNGINLAYLCILKAAEEVSKPEAIAYFENARTLNNKIISICTELINGPDFSKRDDIEYIYETLAQAYLGNDMNHDVIKLIPTINEISKGSFDLDTFHEQNNKIIDAIVKFKKKHTLTN